MIIQRLIVWIYFGGLGLLALAALARLFFLGKGGFSERLVQFLKSIPFILLWPLAMIAKGGRTVLLEATPFEDKGNTNA